MMLGSPHDAALLVLLIAGVNGLVRPSDLAMRQALVADIMPNERLMRQWASRAPRLIPRASGSLPERRWCGVGIGPAYVAVAMCYGGDWY